MKHLDVLGTFENFNYIYYSDKGDKFMEEYNRMYEEIHAAGHALSRDPWPVDTGIILMDDSGKSIAGAFFNLEKYKQTVLLLLIYVNPEFRKKGIYLQLHKLIDFVGKNKGKNRLYSYIHSGNSLMTDYMIERMGYREVMKLVERDI